MLYSKVTYYEILTHADRAGVQVIPWEYCHIEKKLGSGASMTVFSGTCRINGIQQKVAFKFPNTELDEKTPERKLSNVLRDIRQEIRLMGQLKDQPRVVQLLAISFDGQKPVLILELADESNLQEYLMQNNIGWEIKISFAYDIALALECVHNTNIVHGDLKAPNILIFNGNNNIPVAKISDFGFSSTDFSVLRGEGPGFTFLFRARETFDSQFREWSGKHSVDLYSYGLVVWQIATNGKTPFEDMESFDIDDAKRNGTELQILEMQLPNDTPVELRNVIAATIRNIPSERASLSEVREILKKSIYWNEMHERAKAVFDYLAQNSTREPITVTKLIRLPISISLRNIIFAEYQKLADAGDVVSQSRLGSCWDFGFGTEKDFLKAVEWYTKAADGGDATAQTKLGIYYFWGDRVQRDPIKAIELFTKAAEANDSFASHYLGLCYERGIGVQRNLVKASFFFSKAAAAGDIDAQAYLAYCYNCGIGVPRDSRKSVELCIKAGESGNSFAYLYLTFMHFFGIGVSVNWVTAFRYLMKAFSQGLFSRKDQQYDSPMISYTFPIMLSVSMTTIRTGIASFFHNI